MKQQFNNADTTPEEIDLLRNFMCLQTQLMSDAILRRGVRRNDPLSVKLFIETFLEPDNVVLDYYPSRGTSH